MPTGSINFDRAASFYDETRGFPPGEEQAVANLFVRAGGLAPASRLLEIGVGTGRIALPLAPHVAALVGLDLSRAMMRRLLDRRTTEPVHLVQGDATHLPFPPGCFDAVLAVHVFHLIPTWEQVLQGLVRVLRPGGLLLHGYNQRDEGDIAALWSAWRASLAEEGLPEHVGVQDMRQETFLLEAGWQPTGERLSHNYTLIYRPQNLIDGIQTRRFSSTWRLTDAQIERGMAAVRAEALSRFGDPDRPVEMSGGFVVEAYHPPR